MGLDIFLKKRSSDGVKKVEKEVFYWRKKSWVLDWFIDKRKEECKEKGEEYDYSECEFEVSRTTLIQLLDDLKAIIKSGFDEEVVDKIFIGCLVWEDEVNEDKNIMYRMFDEIFYTLWESEIDGINKEECYFILYYQ